MSLVSNNIKYLRRLNGLTQEQFARRIGIKRSLLGAYEEARANPNLDNLMAIARAFNTTVDNLLKSDLRKIRETPDLTIPLDRPAAAGERTGPVAQSPLLRETAGSAEATPAPKPLAAVLEKYYQSPGGRSQALEVRQPGINLVAQRVTPRPVSHREGFAPASMPYRPATVPVPSFNNVSETSSAPVRPAERPAFAPGNGPEPAASSPIQVVGRNEFREYEHRFQQTDYLKNLPQLQLPTLPSGHYRAFEAEDSFQFPNALLIGQFVRNWYEIADGRTYILVTNRHGVLHRKVFNQVKSKGTLLLTSDQPSIPNQELPIRDVLEVWEVKAFFSTRLPEPPPSLDRLQQLVRELQFELERLQKK